MLNRWLNMCTISATVAHHVLWIVHNTTFCWGWCKQNVNHCCKVFLSLPLTHHRPRPSKGFNCDVLYVWTSSFFLTLVVVCQVQAKEITFTLGNWDFVTHPQQKRLITENDHRTHPPTHPFVTSCPDILHMLLPPILYIRLKIWTAVQC